MTPYLDMIFEYYTSTIYPRVCWLHK